ncbi:hypothetical protein RY831_04780 [Noviherbaspirillum sp. CPCC 100848]|uniref:Uncharacterized protein n=1 Tax=Noviherbaspirillum album TaxID=3080276 RepID=A0ABU6J488_9BURK|nr:hypothetical protein [Noviherbaspirillum sp. CPCC 100848]MEC4718449.1 hypothetical protein [Noviherbaspirillum sp. CPCC 100848]
MNSQLVKAGGYLVGFLEPADTAVNDAASLVLLGIEGRWRAPAMPDLVQPLGIDGTDVVR